MTNGADIPTNNPNDPVDLRDDDRLAALVDAAGEILDQFDSRADELYDDLFVNTADGAALEQYARALQISPTVADSDSELRTRILARRSAQRSNTTAEDFGLHLKTVLNVDASQFNVSKIDTDGPGVSVTTNATLFSNIPFTADEVTELLGLAVPAGHPVKLNTTGTFRLDGPDYTPPADSGLGDGTLGYTNISTQ